VHEGLGNSSLAARGKNGVSPRYGELPGKTDTEKEGVTKVRILVSKTAWPAKGEKGAPRNKEVESTSRSRKENKKSGVRN